MTRQLIIVLIGSALLAGCASQDGAGQTDEDSTSSAGEEATTVVSTTTSTTSGTTGPALPGDCISCSLLVGFLGMGGGMPMDGGMMPPADGGGLPMPALCEGADALIDALLECGCTGSCAETCASACGAEFGIEGIPCLSCAVEDPACAPVVAACEADDPTQLEGSSTGATDGGASSTGDDAGGSSGTTGASA